MGRERAMRAIPLYFDLAEEARGGKGDGFLATVRLRGRILCEREDGAIWMSGVNPVGVAQYGDTPAAAYGEFRGALLDAVHDFAGWAGSLDEFRREFEAFFRNTSSDLEREWLAARQEIRSGEVPDLELRRETADLEPLLEVSSRRARASGRRSGIRPSAKSRGREASDTLAQTRLAA